MNSRPVLAVATAFEGLRAGVGILRLVLDLPARAAMGTLAYAEYFRATDLTPRGIAFYATYGFGGLLLTGAAWLTSRRAGAPSRVVRLTAFSAAASLVILLLTTQAAPIAMQVRTTSDPAALTALFDGFVAWSVPRLLCALASFAALVVALAHKP
jgi:hypothetical protein